MVQVVLLVQVEVVEVVLGDKMEITTPVVITEVALVKHLQILVRAELVQFVLSIPQQALPELSHQQILETFNA
jgi:hypothetical protein